MPHHMSMIYYFICWF